MTQFTDIYKYIYIYIRQQGLYSLGAITNSLPIGEDVIYVTSSFIGCDLAQPLLTNKELKEVTQMICEMITY